MIDYQIMCASLFLMAQWHINMFINESILKGNRKRIKIPTNSNNTLKKQPQATSAPAQTVSFAPTFAEDNYDQVMPLSEIQFQKNIAISLDQLYNYWQKSLGLIEVQLKQFSQVGQTESEERAFDECKLILDQQFRSSQAAHNTITHIQNKKILQAGDLKLRLKKQVQLGQQEKQILNEELKRTQKQLQQAETKKANKTETKTKVEEQKRKGEEIKCKYQQCKEKSHQQKQQYIGEQEKEFRLEEQLAKLQQQEISYQQAEEMLATYKKLLKIKQKIIKTKDQVQDEVTPHLERKISKMARLRASLKEIQETLEDQNYIIDGLKEKVYATQRSPEVADSYHLYKRKYDELYLSKNPSSDWNDYKQYLKHLTDYNRKRNSRVMTEVNFDQKKDILDLRPSRATKDKFNTPKNPQRDPKLKTEYSSDANSTKLPRIVKLDGKPSPTTKNQIKEGIKTTTKQLQQDFQLQSIRSDQSQISGEVINVQFHQRAKK